MWGLLGWVIYPVCVLIWAFSLVLCSDVLYFDFLHSGWDGVVLGSLLPHHRKHCIDSSVCKLLVVGIFLYFSKLCLFEHSVNGVEFLWVSSSQWNCPVSNAAVPVLPERLLSQWGTSSHHTNAGCFLSLFSHMSCFLSHKTRHHSSSVSEFFLLS